MIILRISPFHVGIEPVICSTAFILVAQTLLRGLFPFSINLDDAPGTEIHICVDKDLQAVGLIL